MSKVASFIKKRKVLLIVLAILIVIGIVIFNVISSATRAVSGMLSLPSATPLALQDIENVVVASGLTASVDSQVVSVVTSPNTTGVELVTLDIEIGDEVKAGQILGTLDDETVQDSIQNAQDAYDDSARDLGYENAIQSHDLEQVQKTADEAAEKYNKDKDEYNTNLAKINEQIAAQKTMIASLETNLATKTYDWLNPDPTKEPILESGEVDLDFPITESELNTAYDNLPQDIKDNTSTTPPTPLQTYIRNSYLQLVALKNDISSARTQLDTFEDQAITLTDNYSQTESNNLDTLESAVTTLERQTLSYNSAIARNSDSLNDSYDDIIDAQESIEDTVIRAPMDGVVTDITASVGSAVSGSVCTIQNLNSMEIAATVPSYDVVKLREGMSAIITTDSTGAVELKGTITNITPIAVDQQGNFSVTISVDEGHEDLRAGVPAKITFMIETAEQAFAVPIDAVMEENGTHFVWVYDTMPTAEQAMLGDADGRRRVDVALGLESDYLVEIISAELSEGLLILDDPQGLNVVTDAMMMFDVASPGGEMPGTPPAGGGQGGGGNRP